MIPKSCDCGGHFHVRSTKREKMMLVHRVGDFFFRHGSSFFLANWVVGNDNKMTVTMGINGSKISYFFLVYFFNSKGFKCWEKNQKDEGTNSFHLHVSFA